MVLQWAVTQWVILGLLRGAFDGAMAAMDTAASANMAEGMEAANTAADAADAAAADAPADDAPTDDVV